MYIAADNEGTKLSPEQVTIQFTNADRCLKVVIETPRLLIRSVTLDDTQKYLDLFSDADVMRTYLKGKPITDVLQLQAYINRWVQRWEKNDPFSGLAVFNKVTKEFIGHVILGYSDAGNGISELAYLFHKKFWNQGIGVETICAVVNYYALELFKRGFKINGHNFNYITATTKVDNVPSQKILQRVGFYSDHHVIDKFGAERYVYKVDVRLLMWLKSRQTVEMTRSTSNIFTHQKTQSGHNNKVDPHLVASTLRASL